MRGTALATQEPWSHFPFWETACTLARPHAREHHSVEPSRKYGQGYYWEWKLKENGNSDNPTKVAHTENVMSQDPAYFIEAEGGLQAAVHSSLIKSSNGILSRGEEGISIYICQFHQNLYRREGTKN